MQTKKHENVCLLIIDEVQCNKCGKKIPRNKHGYLEDYLNIDKYWGYNSEFDGESHSFDICGECYKELIAQFIVDIEVI